MTLTVGSLFSGIGGLDLGLERAGMRVIWQSEIDPYASRVLAKHWPDVPNLGDVTTVDWSTVERPDLICGGYPCQPFSLAGVRRGEHDPRHLWPHMLRAIRHLRPRYALLENVPGHLSLGFGRVLGDLAESGYCVEWDCIPAAAVGAPHRRDRIFAVAHAHGEGEPGVPVDAEQGQGLLVSDTDNSAGWRGTEWRPGRDGEPALHGPHGTVAGDVPDTDRVELREQQVSVGGGGGASATRDDGPTQPLAGPDSAARSEPGRAGETVFGPEAKQRLRRCRSSLRRTWATEPDVGRVVARFSPELDGGLNAHAECIEEACAKGVPGTARLRALREHLASAATPQERATRCALCGHPLSAVPCRGACAPWRLGSGGEDAEDVRCMREGLLGLLAHQGEDVQPFLSLGVGAKERTQTMGSRVDRLRALGNAVVPQVAEWIGHRILVEEGFL